jgi:hypothetical protein
MALVDRVKNILLTPSTEWQVIDGEATTPGALYAGYIVPLAAIGPIAQVIGSTVFGYGMPFTGHAWRMPIGAALSGAVVRYVLSLIAVYLLALIIDALAPTFDGTKSQIQALKVSAYASTASWVAGIFALVPGLRVLGILGLYSLYLLYLGLPVLMKASAEKAVAYTAVVILAAVVLFMIVGAVVARLAVGPMGG